jgi:hypothetical protein
MGISEGDGAGRVGSIMKIGCKQCGTYDAHPPCEKCGVPIHVGSWPGCPHEKAMPAHGFESYFDIGLGIHVSGRGDVLKALRPKWENDHIVQLLEK